MRQDKFSKAHLILYACGIIPVVWLALLLAPTVAAFFWNKGGWIQNLSLIHI